MPTFYNPNNATYQLWYMQSNSRFWFEYGIINLHTSIVPTTIWHWLSNPEAFPGLHAKIKSGLFPAGCARNTCAGRLPDGTLTWSLNRLNFCLPTKAAALLWLPLKKPTTAACVHRLLLSAMTHHSWPQVRAGTKINQYMKSFPLQLSALLCHKCGSERKTAPAAPMFWLISLLTWLQNPKILKLDFTQRNMQ